MSLEEFYARARQTYTLPGADPATADLYQRTTGGPQAGEVKPTDIANAVANQQVMSIQAPDSTYKAPDQSAWLGRVDTSLPQGAVPGAQYAQYRTNKAGSMPVPKDLSGAAPAYAKMLPSIQKWLGKTVYKYGGMDCSKWVQTIAADAGYSIPRDTASQLEFFRSHNKLVPPNQARPGDVIIMSSKASPSGRHVGIYIGGGWFVDNPGTGKPVSKHRIGSRSILGVGRL